VVAPLGDRSIAELVDGGSDHVHQVITVVMHRDPGREVVPEMLNLS
jgi:hypothetical protein